MYKGKYQCVNLGIIMKKSIVSIGLICLAMPLFAAGMDSVHPSEITHFIETHNPLIYLAAFFGLGILLAFTPCVLPMVPILSGIITGQNAHTGKRAFQLSLGYVLGMSITYAIAGMLAAYFGSTVQSLMQQPFIIATFSGLFVLMAFWLLDVFQVRMPAFLQRYTKAAGSSVGCRYGCALYARGLAMRHSTSHWYFGLHWSKWPCFAGRVATLWAGLRHGAAFALSWGRIWETIT